MFHINYLLVFSIIAYLIKTILKRVFSSGLDCTEDDVKNLYQPICPYIYFAGEHTMPGLMGTVQGAYQSGIRAAEQLITGFCKEVLAAEQAQKKRNMTTLTNSTTDSLNKADKSTKNENITKKDEL